MIDLIEKVKRCPKSKTSVRTIWQKWDEPIDAQFGKVLEMPDEIHESETFQKVLNNGMIFMGKFETYFASISN